MPSALHFISTCLLTNTFIIVQVAAIVGLVAALRLSNRLRYPPPRPPPIPIPADADVIAAVAKQPPCDSNKNLLRGLLWPGPDDPRFYIKYGHGFNVESRETHQMRDYFMAAEARNQEYIFHALHQPTGESIFRAVQRRLPWNKKWQVRVPSIYRAFRHDDTFYVVMEYVQGKPYAELARLEPKPLPSPASDASYLASWDSRYNQLARAIDLLLAIPAPDARPGPVGGGLIRHPLFQSEWTACRAYDSVEELEKEINLLAELGHRRVRYKAPRACPKATLERDLHFCLSDFYFGNFIIVDEDHSLCLLDLDHAGFLPLSFLGWSISGGYDNYLMMGALTAHLRTRIPTYNNSALDSAGRIS